MMGGIMPSRARRIVCPEGTYFNKGSSCKISLPYQSHHITTNMEDIAIIGFSLRFPQDAVSPETFWNLLVEGRSTVTEVPESRFNINAVYHPDPDRLGNVSS